MLWTNAEQHVKLGSYWGSTPEVEVHEIKPGLQRETLHLREGRERRGGGKKGRERKERRKGRRDEGRMESPRTGKNCLEKNLVIWTW